MNGCLAARQWEMKDAPEGTDYRLQSTEALKLVGRAHLCGLQRCTGAVSRVLTPGLMIELLTRRIGFCCILTEVQAVHNFLKPLVAFA